MVKHNKKQGKGSEPATAREVHGETQQKAGSVQWGRGKKRKSDVNLSEIVECTYIRGIKRKKHIRVARELSFVIGFLELWNV